MSKHNYKKLYEEAIFDKINLEKQIEKNNLVLFFILFLIILFI